jgi:Uma2 family endonuclease
MTPPPDERVDDPVVSRLNRLFIAELLRLGQPGELFFPRSGIWTYYPDTWLEPDLFYLSKESIERFKDKPRTSADLVIEVLSPGSIDYDRTTKADSYVALGVKELWLVDPQLRTVEVLRNDGKRWAKAPTLNDGDVVTSSVVSGLTISVSDILAG